MDYFKQFFGYVINVEEGKLIKATNRKVVTE